MKSTSISDRTRGGRSRLNLKSPQNIPAARARWRRSAWIWRMAWRDSRSSRNRLLLFVSSIILGVAALVAINSFGHNLEAAINEQAKTLLGADLVLRSRQPLTPEAEQLIASLGGDQSRVVHFASMVYFPQTGGTRLANVRALEGDFPYYGTLETNPTEAVRSLVAGPHALVEESLMLQFDAQVGDPIKIGAVSYRIAGRLIHVPGEVSVDFGGPRVYIPMAYLSQTKLLQRGSLANYYVYFKFDEGFDTEGLVQKLKPRLVAHRLSADTVEERQADFGEAMANVYRFLGLVGFIALLLGSIGVSSAVHVYVKQKLGTVAILRCVGARAKQTFAVYLVQAIVVGFIGAACGALVGIGVQTALPGVLGDFLPVEVAVSISWSAVLQGISIGVGMTLLFALLPLVSIRKVSPLLTLRASYEETETRIRDPLRWLIALIIVIGVASFAMAQAGRWLQGLGFAAGIGVAFGLLAGVARLMMALVKRYFPDSWAYVWRQGLANLHRPNNQTLVLMLSLGLGTFLIMTLYLTQHTLLEQIALTSSGDRPSMVMFDIQSDQKAGVADLVRSFGSPVLQEVPIVTMRLAAVKGKRVEDVLNEPDRDISRWALRREYRSTYRDHLIDTEEIIAGSWQGRVETPSDMVPISLERDIAEDVNVAVGDELVFDVQGVPVRTVVGSLRQVNWRRVQPNFFVVFPAGVLEAAPQFHVLVTRVDSSDASARLQRALVQQFPNVSVIDLRLIVNTVDAVLSKVSFVIRFMAIFSILTGLIVLTGAIVGGRYQRIQESVLLRTLGASRAQITTIMTIEYFFLGGIAALTGLILSLGASWALARFVFQVDFVPAALPMLAALALVIGLTILTGRLNSRGIADRPPLEILRVDV